MRRRLEFVLVWAAVKLLSLPPRSVARGIGAFIGRLALLLTPRLAGVGDLNLRLAFPEKRRRRAATDSAQAVPQSWLVAGRVLPDAALHPGNDAQLYPL